MLRLITEGQTPNNPTIPIRWCIEESDREKLMGYAADNIYVLIVVAYENGEEDRQLRPLDEAMTYVSFRFAGRHTIFARLVWGDLMQMKSGMLQRDNSRSYYHNVINYDRDNWLGYFPFVAPDCFNMPSAEPLNIVFEKGSFAKEPPKWFSEWVNFWYSSPPVDQCQLRRRMLFAFTAQPFIFLVDAVVVRLIALVPLLVGGIILARNLNVQAVLKGHPTEVWPSEWMGHDLRRSLWIVEDRKGNWKLHRVFVSPLFLMICFSVLMHYHSVSGMGYIEILTLATTTVVLWVQSMVILIELWVIASIIFSGLVLFTVIKIFKKIAVVQEAFEKTHEYLERVRRENEESRRRYIENAYRCLTCPMSGQEENAATLEALPPERRTLRLRFYDLKRTICRPYAR